MMPCKFKALDGSMKEMDLDEVIDLVIGYSGYREGWTATVVYDPANRIFVELRSAPPDYRGNAPEEAAQVSVEYIGDRFCLGEGVLQSFIKSPRAWKLVNKR